MWNLCKFINGIVIHFRLISALILKKLIQLFRIWSYDLIFTSIECLMNRKLAKDCSTIRDWRRLTALWVQIRADKRFENSMASNCKLSVSEWTHFGERVDDRCRQSRQSLAHNRSTQHQRVIKGLTWLASRPQNSSSSSNSGPHTLVG